MSKEIIQHGFFRKEQKLKEVILTSQPVEIKHPENPQPGDILISRNQIQERIKQMATDIVLNNKDQNLLVIFILSGAVTFGVHLQEALHDQGLQDAHYDSMRVESYKGNKKSGKLRVTAHPKNELKGRNVLVVEDIIDSGESMTFIDGYLVSRGVRSITTASLLSKPGSRKVRYESDYTGFIIPDIWVEGFGLDTDEWNRDEPNIVIGYERPKSKKQSIFELFTGAMISLARKSDISKKSIFTKKSQ